MANYKPVVKDQITTAGGSVTIRAIDMYDGERDDITIDIKGDFEILDTMVDKFFKDVDELITRYNSMCDNTH